MSRQMSFADMFLVTSSPVSEDGPSPCSEQAGQKTEPSGPEAAPVSPSQRMAHAGAWTTSGTSGPSGSASLLSAGLSSALASRLAARVECDGSTLYAMTWRDTSTPSGRYHPRLAVTALRTQESGCTGWPTPTAKDGDSSGRVERAAGSHPGTTLTDAARGHGGSAPSAKTAKAVSLNPAFSLWLMGFPVAWLCSGVRGMRLSYRRRKRSSGPTRIFRRTPWTHDGGVF